MRKPLAIVAICILLSACAAAHGTATFSEPESVATTRFHLHLEITGSLANDARDIGEYVLTGDVIYHIKSGTPFEQDGAVIDSSQFSLARPAGDKVSDQRPLVQRIGGEGDGASLSAFSFSWPGAARLAVWHQLLVEIPETQGAGAGRVVRISLDKDNSTVCEWTGHEDKSTRERVFDAWSCGKKRDQDGIAEWSAALPPGFSIDWPSARVMARLDRRGNVNTASFEAPWFSPAEEGLVPAEEGRVRIRIEKVAAP